MSAIYGHMGQFKIFKNGALSDIVDITSVDVNQESSFQRTFYVGRPVGESSQSVEGWSGSCELQVKDAAVDEFIDALINENLAGVGISDYSFTTTEQYADGSSQSYVYTGCVFKMSRRNGGSNEKITKRLDFQADFRTKI